MKKNQHLHTEYITNYQLGKIFQEIIFSAEIEHDAIAAAGPSFTKRAVDPKTSQNISL